jgi:hypothetical protein
MNTQCLQSTPQYIRKILPDAVPAKNLQYVSAVLVKRPVVQKTQHLRSTLQYISAVLVKRPVAQKTQYLRSTLQCISAKQAPTSTNRHQQGRWWKAATGQVSPGVSMASTCSSSSIFVMEEFWRVFRNARSSAMCSPGYIQTHHMTPAAPELCYAMLCNVLVAP